MRERELVDDTSHSMTPPPKLFGFFSISLRNCDVGFGFDRLKFPSFKVKTLSLSKGIFLEPSTS